MVGQRQETNAAVRGHLSAQWAAFGGQCVLLLLDIGFFCFANFF